jgi:hypothetical protein
MGRIRTIKPEFFQDEELSALGCETHMLAAGLLCYADDFGYFNANYGLIRAAIFPLRELSGEIPEMVGSLAEIGYLRLGVAADGKRYGHIVKFLQHQRVSHPTASRIADLEIKWESSGEIPEDSGSLPSGSALKGREQGKEQEGKTPTARGAGDGALFPVGLKDEPEGITPLMVVDAVMTDLHLGGMHLRVVIEEVCRKAMKGGTSADDLRASMVSAWQDYRQAKPRLRYDVGAQKFFGEDIWRDRVGWPWKEGHEPPKRAAVQPKEPAKPVHQCTSNAIPMAKITAMAMAGKDKGGVQ